MFPVPSVEDVCEDATPMSFAFASADDHRDEGSRLATRAVGFRLCVTQAESLSAFSVTVKL